MYRDPAPAPTAPFGWRYNSVTIVGPDEPVASLAAPAHRIAVADLLP
jgi:hypothetical protein